MRLVRVLTMLRERDKGLVPCARWCAAIMTAVITMVAVPSACYARLGAVAVPGDNCTPYNGYAVGYPLPSHGGHGQSQSRISDQRILLGNGWNVFGWIITTQAHDMWFLPYRPFFTSRPRNLARSCALQDEVRGSRRGRPRNERTLERPHVGRSQRRAANQGAERAVLFGSVRQTVARFRPTFCQPYEFTPMIGAMG